jgi:hypothetical protein
MSVLACIGTRNGKPLATQRLAERLEALIRPAGIPQDRAAPRIEEVGGMVVIEFFPIGRLRRVDNSISFGPRDSTAIPRPDGALQDGDVFRLDIDQYSTTLTTDLIASRTLWYAVDQDLFVASTSQRIIVALLGSHEPGDDCCGWILASGNLPPGRSWDRRIESVPPGGRVVLDRKHWTVRPHVQNVEFNAGDDDPAAVVKLRNAIESCFADLQVGDDEGLLLSGGFDSRAILYLLSRSGKSVKTFTKVHDSALLARTLSDASIAQRIAASVGQPNTLVLPGSDDYSLAEFDRLVCGVEGRLCNIDTAERFLPDVAKYGIRAAFIGREAFGWHGVVNERQARQACGLFLRSDFDFGPAQRAIGRLFPGSLPATLQRHPAETIASWRDRLYQTFREPCMLAANGHHASLYLETYTPFLSDSIIRAVRNLSDRQRTNKTAFIGSVPSWGKAFPHADDGIQARAKRGARRKWVNSGAARDILHSTAGDDVLPSDALAVISAMLDRADEHSAATDVNRWRNQIKSRIKWATPDVLLDLFKRRRLNAARRLDPVNLVIRACVLVRMGQILAADAKCLDGEVLSRAN